MNIVDLLEEKAEFVKPSPNGQVWELPNYDTAEALIEELNEQFGEIAKAWNFIPWQNYYPSNVHPQIIVKV